MGGGANVETFSLIAVMAEPTPCQPVVVDSLINLIPYPKTFGMLNLPI